jgi:hypothetical protein
MTIAKNMLSFDLRSNDIRTPYPEHHFSVIKAMP